MLRLITELDEFKGQWRMMRSLPPEKLTGLRKVAAIERVGSSTRVKGSKLTDPQVEDLLDRPHIPLFAPQQDFDSLPPVDQIVLPQVEALHVLYGCSRNPGKVLENKCPKSPSIGRS